MSRSGGIDGGDAKSAYLKSAQESDGRYICDRKLSGLRCTYLNADEEGRKERQEKPENR